MKNISEYPEKMQKAWMLIHLIAAYYQTDGAGGACHVVIDDGNYGDDSVQSCLNYAKTIGDFWGETIAKLLLEFTEEERIQINERPHEIEFQIPHTKYFRP